MIASTVSRRASFLLVLFLSAPAAAQSSGCTIQTIGGREFVSCGTGIKITAEAGASYDLIDRNGDGTPDRVRLDGKAMLLEVTDVPAQPGFDVVAPQAIAAVRGTRWVVDAESGRTSVLVLDGSVEVTRPSGSHGVTLAPGEGVDVEPGTGPLTVRRWPQPRVEALLARLGL